MSEIKLNKGAIESAFSLKAREFAKESANIFWLRDLKIRCTFEGSQGCTEEIVPNEQEIAMFCEALGVSLCRSFELDGEDDSAYCTLGAGPVIAYIRIAPLSETEEESPIILEVGFMLSLSPATIMPIDGFLERQDNER
jgi:hypothetical protein